MGKQRGLEAKLYFKKTTVASGLFTETPDEIADIGASDFWEITTIKNVEQSREPNYYEFETRESVENIKVPTSESDEITLTIYQDPSDTNGFMRLFGHKYAAVQANKVLGLAILHTGIATTPNIVKAAGNYIVGSMDYGESKTEGIEVIFKLTPYSYTTQGFAVPAP